MTLLLEVLLLDDQPADARASIEFLMPMFGDGNVVMKAITSIPDSVEELTDCDGLVLDYHLRLHMDGLQVAAMAHAHAPGLPIAILTASSPDYELLRGWQDTGARWLWDKWELAAKGHEVLDMLAAMRAYQATKGVMP